MEASSRLLGAPRGPSGGLLEASWRPLGGLLGPVGGPSEALLGAPRRPFGGSGGRFDVKHHFETLEIFGRVVLKPSRGRVVLVILDSFLRVFWLLSPQQIQHAKSTIY